MHGSRVLIFEVSVVLTLFPVIPWHWSRDRELWHLRPASFFHHFLPQTSGPRRGQPSIFGEVKHLRCSNKNDDSCLVAPRQSRYEASESLKFTLSVGSSNSDCCLGIWMGRLLVLLLLLLVVVVDVSTRPPNLKSLPLLGRFRLSIYLTQMVSWPRPSGRGDIGHFDALLLSRHHAHAAWRTKHPKWPEFSSWKIVQLFGQSRIIGIGFLTFSNFGDAEAVKVANGPCGIWWMSLEEKCSPIPSGMIMSYHVIMLAQIRGWSLNFHVTCEMHIAFLTTFDMLTCCVSTYGIWDTAA